MNEKWKWVTARRLRRGVVILAAAGLTAGAGLATAGSALAAAGTIPGGLTLSNMGPAPLTTQPTWGTTTACPTGFTGSADVEEFDLAGNFVSGISSFNNAPTSPLSGQLLLAAVGPLVATAGGPTATNPGTVEWAVGCYSLPGGAGTVSYQGDLYITVTAAGTYTTSATPPGATATTTTLTASPNPAGDGASVTLTATESPATAGSVQFAAGGSPIGSPVAVNGSGVATTTFTTPTPFNSSVTLTATFTPTNTAAFTGSSGQTVLNTSSTLTAQNGAVTISVTVAATGTLTVSVAANTGVNLAVSGSTATGTLPTVTITDTRNNFPGWSVMGQQGTFSTAGPPANSFSGNQLGWTPTAVNAPLPNGAILGPTVAPVTPGLGTTAGVLALAHAGTGADPSGATNDQVAASMLLDIPSNATAGTYSGTLTITYLSAQA